MAPKLTLSSHYSFLEEDYLTYGLGKVKSSKDFINEYELGEMLGYGSYSEVYFATCKTTGSLFACKIINKKNVSQPWRLREEIKILRSLRHSNIVGLHDIYETDL